MAPKISVDIVGDASKLNKAFGQAGNSAKSFGSKMASAGKIAAVGLAAGVGVAVYAAEKFAKAAVEAEKSQTRLAASFDHVKAGAAEQAKAMDAVNKVMNQSGLDDEDLMDSLARLTAVTGDVSKAQRDMGIAADVARGRGIDLAAATAIVSKAELGNVGALKRIGIEIPKVTAAQDALRASHKKATVDQKAAAKAADDLATRQAAIAGLQKKFGGDAEKYGKTAAGAMDRFQVAVHNVEEGLGGALLPVLTKVGGQVATFLNKFNEAKGLHAKLNVVWEGIQDAAKSLTNSIGDAIAMVDWRAAWTKARGIGEGLAERLAGIDWTAVGAAIGDGIAVGIQKVGAVAKNIATAVTEATRTINWEAVGRAVGPGLATALVVAFATLTDPSFWAKNWDLALAVGLVAFGGSIERVGLKLLSPFRKVGVDAVLAVAASIERTSPLLARAFLAAMERLPGLVLAPFRKIEQFVKSTVTRLDNLGFFVLKVLGVELIIQQVHRLEEAVAEKVKEIIEWFHSIPEKVKAEFAGAGTWLFAAGQKVLSGFLDGLKSKAGDIKDWLANKFTPSLPNWKGPPARDAALLVESGVLIMSGFLKGIQTGWGKTERALSAMTGKVQKMFVLPGNNAGLLVPGNLDLLHRQIARIGNDIATVRSVSISTDQGETLIPTVIEGRVVSLQKAIDHFRKTNEHLGVFDSIADANAYAERLHEQQDKFYSASKKTGEVAGKGMADGFKSAASGMSVGLAGLQKQLDAINKRREDQDLASAVRSAQSALDAARKKGEGIAQAERDLAAAREAIVTTGLQREIDKEQAAADKRTAVIQKALDKQQGIIQKAQDKAAAIFDKLSSKIMQAFDAETAAHKSPAQLALEQLQAGHDAAQAAADMADAQKQLSAAQSGGDPNEIVAAQARIDDLVYQQQVTALQAQADQESTAYDQMRTTLGEKLQDRLDLISKKLTEEGGTYDTAMAAIAKTLRSYGITFAEAGADLGESFVKSLKATIAAGSRSAQVVSSAVGGGGAGDPFFGGFQKMASGGIVKAKPGGSLMLLGEAGRDEAVVPLGPGRAGTGTNVTVNVYGSVTSENDLAETVRSRLLQLGRRNGTVGLA